MSSIENKKNLGIVTIAIAVFLCLFLVGIRMKYKTFVDSAETTTGYVTYVSKVNGTKARVTYRSYVKYTVDGVDYTTSFGEDASKMKVGDAICVYYEEGNPSKVITDIEVNYYNLGLLFPCLLLIGVGILLFIIGKKEENNHIA